MADYERDGERGISDAEFYRLHKVRSPSSTGPCSDGSRVRKYIVRRDESIWIYESGDALGGERATPVEDLPSSLDASAILSFRKMISEPDVQLVVEGARSTQKRSRQIWNPKGDEVTLNNS